MPHALVLQVGRMQPRRRLAVLLVVCLGCKASAFRAPGSFVAERHAAAALPRRHAAARRPPPRPLLACSPAAGSGREREAPGAARDAGGETVQSRRRVLRSGLSLAAAGALTAAGTPQEARAICGAKPQSWEFWIPVCVPRRAASDPVRVRVCGTTLLTLAVPRRRGCAVE